MAFEVVDFKSPFQIQVGLEKDVAAKEGLEARAKLEKAQAEELTQKLAARNAFSEAEARRLASQSGATPFDNMMPNPAGGFGLPVRVEKEGGAGIATSGPDGPRLKTDPSALSLSSFARANIAAQEGQQAILTEALNRYKDAQGRYKSAVVAKDYDMQQTVKKEMDTALKEFSTERQRLHTEAVKDITSLQHEISSVTNANGLVDVINNAAAKYGPEPILKAVMGAGLVDPATGKLVFNPIAIKNLQRSLLKAKEQLDEDERAWRREHDTQKFEADERQRKIANFQNDRTYALNREEFQFRSGPQFEAIERQRAINDGQQINKTLSESPLVKDFDTLNANKQSVDSMMSGLMTRTTGGQLALNKGAYEKLGLAGQQTLIRYFTQAQENFDRHGNTIYNDKEIKAMNGMLRNAYLTVSSWGTGTPKMDDKSLSEVLTAYNRIHSAQNTIVSAKSLAAVERAIKSGADVNMIDFKGSIQQGVKDKTMQIVQIDGKPYVRFPQKGVSYPLPEGVSDAY